MIVQRSTS